MFAPRRLSETAESSRVPGPVRRFGLALRHAERALQAPPRFPPQLPSPPARLRFARSSRDGSAWAELCYASAEFIMTLPDELQARGDDLLGWPDHDVLRACGATFVREV